MFDDINDVPSLIGTVLNDVLDRQLPLKSKGTQPTCLDDKGNSTFNENKGQVIKKGA